MLRTRTTLILAGIALVLGAWYYEFEVRGLAAREATRAAERRVLDFETEKVRGITIEKPGERLVVRGEAGRWHVVAPERAAADAATIEGLLAFLRRLERVRTLDGMAGNLREFGLDAPAIRLLLDFQNGDVGVLVLGGRNPAGTGVYARVEGSPTIFLAPERLAIELAKSPYLDEVRARTLLAVEAERVRRIEIERADVRIAVARVGARQWRVEEPFAGPGDDGIIRDLLWKLGATQARTVIRRPGPPGEYGLDRPHARVRIVDDAGEARALTVVADERRGALYAKLEGETAVWVVDGQLLADLALDPRVLRDRQLLVYDEREVERITIGYPRQTLVLERAGGGWRVTQPVEGEAVPSVVQNILEVLPNLRYTALERDPSRELRHYGLDPPDLALTVGLRGGRELPTLAVGREEAGSRFVRVGRGGPVYSVDSRLFRALPDDPTDAKRYPLTEQLQRGLRKLEGSRR